MTVGLTPDALQRNTHIGSAQQPMSLTDGFLLIRRWQAFLEVGGRVNASTRTQYRRAPGADPGRETDLDFNRAWIEFRVAKNDDPYGVPMNARASAACRELLDLADYKPRNSPGRRATLIGVGRSRAMQWIQDIEDLTGIPVWSHLFRHTLLTELAHDPTVPIMVTSKIANHKDPRTTLRYVADREGAMGQAMAGR